uniref:Sphingomyelin synthase-like domain-containing protein n=1 Tax=Arion vulgaris TaxID=1028688 RepID=A0A0B7BI86_9EUPU
MQLLFVWSSSPMMDEHHILIDLLVNLLLVLLLCRGVCSIEEECSPLTTKVLDLIQA